MHCVKGPGPPGSPANGRPEDGYLRTIADLVG